MATNASTTNLLMKTTLITGLDITQNESKDIEVSGDGRIVTKVQRIVGTSYEIPFRLDLQIRENLDDEGPLSETRITALRVSLGEDLESLLKTFIERMEDNQELMLCMRGLSDYGYWSSLRRKTFDHYLEAYPEMMSVQSSKGGVSEQLIIDDTDALKVRYRVVWGFRVVRGGRLVPDIGVEVDASERALAFDRKNLLGHLPRRFSQLVEKDGVEEAINVLVTTTRFWQDAHHSDQETEDSD